MNASEYQKLAARTLVDRPGFDIPDRDMMVIGDAIGLAGEAGEVADQVKKGIFHQHGLNVEKLKEEIGDTLWYAAALCTTLGLDMSEIMAGNIDKLMKRYPDGFSAEDSKKRADVPESVEYPSAPVNIKVSGCRQQIICLSGSTKFKDQFLEFHKKFTAMGYITLVPAFFRQSGDIVDDAMQSKLFDLQIEKIKICDILYVINPDNYIGDLTKQEIEIARSAGKQIWYLESNKSVSERISDGYALMEEIAKAKNSPTKNAVQGAE